MFFPMFLFLFVAIVVIVMIVWRGLSRRCELPCPSWLSWLVELDNPFSTINRAKNIIKHSDIHKGMTVIDIGCGPGRLTIPLAEAVGGSGSVVAMDIQQEMLNKVKIKAQAAQLNSIDYLCAGIGEGSLGPNVFDRAMLVTVLGEIPDQKKALQEILYALKPGGILSITETLFDPHYQRRDIVIRLVCEMGFKKKKLFEDCFSYTILFEKSTK